MRTYIILSALLSVLLSEGSSTAQILQPVKWSYGVQNNGEDQRTILIRAAIDKGWHIYSINQQPGGPEKTNIEFNNTNNFSLSGLLIEPQPLSKFENSFNTVVKYFENSVVFRQRIKLRKSRTVIKGNIHFMTCNSQKCLAPEDIPFSISVK